MLYRQLLASVSLLIFITGLCQAQLTASSSTHPELVVQTGHSDRVYSVAFTPDGKVLATASDDKTVKLWDVSTGAELRTIRETGPVTFSPDGNILAIGCTLWEVATGTKLRTITDRVPAGVFSPDWKILAGTTTLWDITTGAELRTFNDRSDIESISFSPDGKILASGGWDGTLKLWDVSTGRELSRIETADAHVHSVTFNPDGKTFASVTSGGPTLATGYSLHFVKIWDVASGKLLRTVEAVPGLVSVAFNPAGKVLASRSASGRDDGTVKLWDLATGAQLRMFGGRCCISLQTVASTIVAFGPDGRTLAMADPGGTVTLWDASTGKELRALIGHSAPVKSIALSADGKLVAVGSEDSEVRLWDVSTDAEPRTLRGHSRGVWSLAFSPDGRTLASGSLDGSVKLWNVANPSELQTLKGNNPADSIQAVAFSADGKTLAGSSLLSGIKLWDLSTGTERRSFRSTGAALTFSPDHKTLAFGDAGTIILSDIATGAELRRFKVHSRGIVWSLAFSADGKTLASASVDKGDVDRTVKLWDIASGKELRSLKGPTIESLAFNSDGKILAGGGSDGTLKLWNTATGAELHTIRGHLHLVNAVAFSANSKYLISASQDATVGIWDVSSGKELATLVMLDQNDWLIVTPDGLFDGSPAAWNQIKWRFNGNTFDQKPVEAFFYEFYRPGLLTEIFSDEYPVAPANIAQKDLRQPQLRLELSNGRTGTAITAREARVKIDVSEAPAGAQDLRLFRNGALVKVWHGDVLKGQSSVTLETTIDLVAGENRLTAYAFNHENVKSSDATLTIAGADSLKRKGVVFIFAVGINQYANADYNLRHAVADAQDLAEALRQQQTKLNNYARVEIVSLLDRDATKSNILKTLKDIGAKIQPEDALVIYFAGHGTAQANHFYLIPHDLGYKGSRTSLDRDGLQIVLAHSISDQELERAVESIAAAQIVLVIDACNSGQALEAEERRRGPMNSKGLAQLAYEKGMYVLTAAQSYQAAREADRLGHGYLTFALVEEGLKTEAADRAPKDGQVLLREWLDYATQRVPQMQQDEIDDQLGRGLPPERVINFAEGGEGKTRNVQRPRVFYRRETEPTPLVVARPAARSSQNLP